MKTDAPILTIEFSRPISIDDIGPAGISVELDADPEERGRLAERFELLDLRSLTACLTVTRASSGFPIRVVGRLRADATQCCVVSLDPFDAAVESEIEVDFVPTSEMSAAQDFAVDDVDPPEPLDGDRIDLGELVAQHVAIALDPYPRKEGAEALAWEKREKSKEDSVSENPFAVLEALHKKRE